MTTPAWKALRRAGSMAWPASGKTTSASTPLATMPWMSEMAFWVSPWPSAYSTSVTLGHLAASSLPDAVVTSRQLLPPKPSVRPRVIFLGPHQEGAPSRSAAGGLALVVAAAVRAAAGERHDGDRQPDGGHRGGAA